MERAMFWFFVFYCLGAFSAWEIDPEFWDGELRACMGSFAVLAFCAERAFKYMYDNAPEENERAD